MDVLSLDKDKTHDVEVSLDSDAGLLRLLVTISDTRLTDKSTTSRPSHHSAALDKYTVCLFCSPINCLMYNTN